MSAGTAGPPMVLFDLDGTLVDSRPGIESSVLAAAARTGVPTPTEAQLRALIGPPFPRAFVDVLGLDAAAATAMTTAYRESYGARGLYDVTVYPGVVEVLTGLAAAGTACGVATSKPAVYARQVLAHVGLADLFDAGVHGASLDGTVEGKDAVVALALDAHPGRDARALVGDRFPDVAGAHTHGLVAVGVTWGFGGRVELEEAGAERVVDTTDELATVLAEVTAARRPTG
jgi:phosphoglycolate phosphatase